MVALSDTSAITRPFNFEPISSTNNTRSKVNRNACNIRHNTFTHRYMPPPKLDSHTFQQPPIKKYLKPGKQNLPQNKS